jgi:diacylglycerol kinase family enzyme
VADPIDLVLNPHASRLGDGSLLRGALGATAAREGAIVHEPRTLDELAAAARTIARRGSAGVIIAGGDGSCMRVLSALANAYGDAPLPAVGLAPGGTVGTIARNLGVPGGEAGVRAVRAACRGEFTTRETPTLQVRDDAGSQAVGFIVGTGLVARFFDVYQVASRPGLATAAGIAARVFVGSLVGGTFARRLLAPMPLAITVDGKRQAGDAWSLLVAGVVRDVGLHFLVTYRAGEDLGRFHVVGSGLSPRRLGPQVARVLLGHPLVGEPRIDALAAQVRLDFGDDSGVYVLDGDAMRARSVVIETGPVLRLMRM